jgi:predicted dehydrogenase
VFIASQISTGEENNLNLRVYGTEGGLEWRQEEPNYLIFKPSKAPAKVLKRGNEYLCEAAKKASRLPPGHPEAFIEAFANIYSSVAATIRSKCDNYEPDGLEQDFPTVYDGAKGVHFIEKAVESSRSEKKWSDTRW